MEPLFVRAVSEVLDESSGRVAGSERDHFLGLQKGMILDASRKNSGTGTPISELRGVALEDAILAVLGGGSKINGGKGTAGGQTALRRAQAAELLAPLAISLADIAALIGIRYLKLVRAQKKSNRAGSGIDSLTSRGHSSLSGG